MIIFAASLAAALVILAVPAHKKHPHHGHKLEIHARANWLPAQRRASTSTLRDETALQRRVARMTRLALLARREAMLRDFLARVRTEAPVYRDDATHRLETVSVSSTLAAFDFLGNLVIRARVSSLLATSQAIELIAEMTGASGASAHAATALTLQPGETRTVELLCAEKLAPASLIWRIVQL